jgi:hypothetical protein
MNQHCGTCTHWHSNNDPAQGICTVPFISPPDLPASFIRAPVSFRDGAKCPRYLNAVRAFYSTPASELEGLDP